ncbi:MAG: hypothetical protein PHQ12_05115, partial [Chthoniobacteraceae bacterium]|nr:hypothetical protein [Chthoniobacteraceae bacterium]
MRTPHPLFRSFFLGGFECSSHCLANGRRLDMLAATRHDRFAEADYRLLEGHGMAVARDALRWHLIESRPGRYNWASFLPMLRAARETGTRVIWDLFHYGYPDGLDLFSQEFVDRFAAFVGEFARLAREEGEEEPWVSPVNEISFFSWAAGDAGVMNPFCRGRGGEIKRQLVRASVAAIQALREAAPQAR